MNVTFKATFSVLNKEFNAGFGTVTKVPLNPYDGPTTVIPKFQDQILETKRKSLLEDVTVTAIPINYIQDTGDGVIAIIGG